MILPHHAKWPEIHETAFVSPSADIIGDVVIGAQSSIWFQVVIRGDVNTIRVGSRTNVQDQSVLHVTRETAPLVVGDDVTVGHRALLHGCKIGNRVLVGMGSIIMDHAVIGDDSVVGAGALVTSGKVFPSRSLIMGSPARKVRELTDAEVAELQKSADNYVSDGKGYMTFLRSPKRHGVDNADLEVFELGEEGDST